MIMAVTAGWALWESFSAILPKIEAKDSAEKGVIFFRHIAKLKLATWQQEVDELTDERLLEDYARQVYITSTICQRKFDDVTRAMRTSAVFLICAILVYIPTLY